ncbi:ankyrin repeat domain-containing protein EMB506, chloroplastic [Euphorbia lathyris]|uniref:ankyrin repeat domain-containing protein EMB506, chloroplastic n=1 Tax=Euphorbia lathyris TaxID=212925 RepID=UPI003313D336
MLATGVATSPLNCLLPKPSAVATSANLSFDFGTNLCKESNTFRTGRCNLFLAKKFSKLSAGVVDSKWDSTSEIVQGVWEEPDDGSGSDSDEEDKELEENDLDYESDWEEETKTASATRKLKNSASESNEEDLVKEIEQLLGPEERAILQQNATYNMGKLSTDKWKPLQTLALSGQIRFMDTLLEEGLDIDSVDKDGFTALHKAIMGRKDSVITHLLRKGASPHITDRDGASPLHHAVQVGALQIVKLLIKCKADVNVADNEGWTPLHVALQTRNRHIVKVLLVNDADKNRRNKDGMTPLDLCLCYGKDFNTYDLAKLVKVVPANRDF